MGATTVIVSESPWFGNLEIEASIVGGQDARCKALQGQLVPAGPHLRFESIVPIAERRGLEQNLRNSEQIRIASPFLRNTLTGFEPCCSFARDHL
jgi:hypothetical protein